MLWKVRPATKEDENFLYSSWLNSYRSAPLVYGISNTVYFKRYHDLLEDLFKEPTTKILVACHPEDESQIFGYSVTTEAEVPVAHWVYVKHPFRGFGIARDLCSRTAFKFHTAKAKISSLTKSSNYDPFLLLSKLSLR